MRDPETLLSLLREMAADDFGRSNLVVTFGMDEDQRRMVHHMELLADAGHVEWDSGGREFPRITNDGYDFIEAVDKNAESMAIFIDKFEKGIPYVKAAIAAVSLLS